ncbi:Bacterial type II secretion system protein F domain protein [Pirellulimonas nuda]|uniref:Bacterial type II secretion system protein F domain protein n=1 Tax=Pirellulimonas nuda TaxID=2528009 RepID=A0A518DF36_9BACT|nr:type II secretion system F family protein [Pirellulimonas nuda]QDU90104.1 Bacterial type II secretion system protein F domain protein [Pirellulimonas nuda]
MTPMLISFLVFVGVAGLIAALAMLSGDKREDEIDQRLAELTGGKKKGKSAKESGGLMNASWETGSSAFEQALANHLNLHRMFVQADTSLNLSKFLLICVGSGAVGFTAAAAIGLPMKFSPVLAIGMTFLPFAWLSFKRKSRMKKFAGQLPEALELVARALRAGHSLASGMSLVAHEMSDPIGKEFNRVFEEQNLGMPMEEALNSMTERVPNLDLKFFATAVVLQRQTGGDLAEILDKIGRLVRERFQIWGQVQALTGEGRISGVVLLALPPALFAAVWRMNPDYLMLLFTDELGKKMLVGGLVMQLLGAVIIRKIVNIRV